ncbi:Tetratricopeptide repeat-containing protein [Alkalispirochaeta americana]|uniref:Tetratricopeptide repeat-containing protein n=1 Tax=Alkalispirochaeta americana TaxID=159291 RepID=A0A1N6UF86_9SPIO|nr:tetratricopeptide repeat protein [Alkalispirochaeta americana]SIQ64232.1 Tetratricopeptide repeat-containing protein [Alkalispirochaeta americana]
MKHARALVVVVVVIFSLPGCNIHRPHILALGGNYSVSRGEYQAAIVSYLRAQESAEYSPWLSYNLGNVYHYLGESEAALERWDSSRESDSRELLFGASFNSGVYYFEQGRYREARRQFRIALEVNPSSVAAKQNFELTLERLSAEADLTGAGGLTERAGPASGISPGGAGTNRMLDYIKRREEQRWRANQETRVSPDVQDW